MFAQVLFGLLCVATGIAIGIVAAEVLRKPPFEELFGPKPEYPPRVTYRYSIKAVPDEPPMPPNAPSAACGLWNSLDYAAHRPIVTIENGLKPSEAPSAMRCLHNIPPGFSVFTADGTCIRKPPPRLGTTQDEGERP